MKLNINYLQHTGIPATNLAISKPFYEKLGFKNVMETTFLHNGAKGTVAMMKLEKIIIELYQVPMPELQNTGERKDGHIDHIAFDVDDIDATFQLLKSEGFTVVEDAPVFLAFWQNGCKYFNITGPDGERLEFCQIL